MTWICSLLLVLGLVLTSTNAQDTSNFTDAITSDQSTADQSLSTTIDKDSDVPVSADEKKANMSVTPSRDTASVTPGMSPTVQVLPTESSSVASRATTRFTSTTTTAPPASPSPARPLTPESPPSTSAVRTTARADTTKDAGLITPSSKTGPIIIIVIIVAVVLLGGVCYLTRKKSRSVDLPSRQDEVQIPLNAGDLEEAADTASQNGIASFAHKDTDVHMASEAEPGNKTQEQGGGKAGADKPDGEGSGEPPAPSPTPANSVDQLAEGGPSEAAPVAPVAPVDQAPVENAPVEQAPTQQKVNELTESNKTSEQSPVEPAKETNDNNNSNNNNNFGITVAGRSLDIPEPLLDSPV